MDTECVKMIILQHFIDLLLIIDFIIHRSIFAVHQLNARSFILFIDSA